MLADRELAEYMQKVFLDLQRDNDITKALRRIHIKEVHLRRRGNYNGIILIKKARRLL